MSAENLATAVAAGARSGGARRQHRRRAGALRGPLFLPGGIACSFRAGQAAGRPRHHRRDAGTGGRTRRGHSGLVLRGPQPGLFQLGRHRRRSRRHARHLPQVAYPRRAGLFGKVLFQPGRHRLSRLADALRDDRRRHLLGPVVPGSGARHGADGRGVPALPDGDRLGAGTARTSIPWSIGASPCAVTPAPT